MLNEDPNAEPSSAIPTRQVEQNTPLEQWRKEKDNLERDLLTLTRRNKTTEQILSETCQTFNNITISNEANNGPRIYEVNDSLLTPLIVPAKLPQAFAKLAVFWQPEEARKEGQQQPQEQMLKQFIGGDLTDAQFEKLTDYCSPQHLRWGTELELSEETTQLGMRRIPTKPRLHSLGDHLHTIKRLRQRISKYQLKTYMLKYANYRVVPIQPESLEIKDDTDSDIECEEEISVEKGVGAGAVGGIAEQGVVGGGREEREEASKKSKVNQLRPGKDLLYRVRIYIPFKCGSKFHVSTTGPRFYCDVVLLGRQRLTALRDRFLCLNDIGLRNDLSDKPDYEPLADAKNVFPSGFMFINNVFYVDLRHPNATDHSAVVRRWAERAGLGVFPLRDMHKVRIQDLKLRLGHPEVYLHQGACEHLFTVSAVRLWAGGARSRVGTTGAAVTSIHTGYCCTCAEFAAKWVVAECPRMPFSPVLLCDTCYRVYLYRDGRKVCPFTAYRYRAHEALPTVPSG